VIVADVCSFLRDFGKDNPQEILAGEFLLCQGIRFAFDVKHPFRPLRGAGMELRRYGDIDVWSSPSVFELLRTLLTHVSCRSNGY
jgi:hypothetical protein